MSEHTTVPAEFLIAANTQCVADIFAKHSRDLQRFLATMVRSRDDVEDLLQETFLRVAAVRNPQEIRSPRAFLFSLAFNLVVDRTRRLKSSVLAHSVSLEGHDYVAELPTVEDVIDADRDLQWFCQAVMRLPVRTQQIFVLRKFCDWSYAELAGHFDLSEQAVRQYVSRGLHECMEFMRLRTDASCG